MDTVPASIMPRGTVRCMIWLSAFPISAADRKLPTPTFYRKPGFCTFFTEPVKPKGSRVISDIIAPVSHRLAISGLGRPLGVVGLFGVSAIKRMRVI